jgi:hypothetical protein
MVCALLFLLPAAPVAAFGLFGYAFGRRGAWRSGVDRLRSTAAVLGAAATCVYGLGLLGLAGAVMDAEDGGVDSAPLLPCRVPGDPERAMHVTGYTVGYLPVRFVCETSNGDDYAPETAPGWVGTAAAGLALAAAAAACGAAAAGARPARRGAAA